MRLSHWYLKGVIVILRAIIQTGPTPICHVSLVLKAVALCQLYGSANNYGWFKDTVLFIVKTVCVALPLRWNKFQMWDEGRLSTFSNKASSSYFKSNLSSYQFNASNIHYIELQGWYHILKILLHKPLQSPLHQSSSSQWNLGCLKPFFFFFNHAEADSCLRAGHNGLTWMPPVYCGQKAHRAAVAFGLMVSPPATHSNPVNCFSVYCRNGPSCHLKYPTVTFLLYVCLHTVSAVRL